MLARQLLACIRLEAFRLGRKADEERPVLAFAERGEDIGRRYQLDRRRPAVFLDLLLVGLRRPPIGNGCSPPIRRRARRCRARNTRASCSYYRR